MNGSISRLLIRMQAIAALLPLLTLLRLIVRSKRYEDLVRKSRVSAQAELKIGMSRLGDKMDTWPLPEPRVSKHVTIPPFESASLRHICVAERRFFDRETEECVHAD